MFYFRLDPAPIFRFTGPDAARYLHARTTNDIKALSVGASCLAAALSPQGKTEGLYSILREEEERFLILSEHGDPAENEQVLKRFLVAERVEVSLLSTHRALHLFGENLSSDSDLCFIEASRSEHPGMDCIGAEEELNQLIERSGAEEVAEPRRTLHRILGNRPTFPTEVRPERVFLEAGPLEAVSNTKGCYPGQEVIEKIVSHGKAPRVLLRGTVSGEVKIDDSSEVTDSSTGRKAGEALSSAYDEEAQKTYLFFSAKQQETPAKYLWQGEEITLL